MTSPEAGRVADAVLVVPVGATEQHGPHLPLTTDTDIALALARRLAVRTRDVVIAPAVAYGSSGEHAAFPGTLSLGNAVTERLLLELGRSATLTWRRILLLSAHGGNSVPVRRAVAQLRAEGRDVRAWSPSWPGDAHAGHTETSVMLHLDAGRVDLRSAAPGVLEPLASLIDALRSRGVHAVSTNGVLGDPTAADAGHGRRLLDAATEELVVLVDAWTQTAG